MGKAGNNTDYKKTYSDYLNRKKMILLTLFLATLLMAFLSINAGAMKLSIRQVIMGLFGLGNQNSVAVVKNLRLPRVITGILAGAGLSVAGCIMQNNLRNPLASPSTLGISNAAAFGANFAIILMGAGNILNTGLGVVQIINPYKVTIVAFICAMLSTILIIFLSRLKNFSPESIVLAGVALSSLFSAGTIIIQYFAKDTVQIAAVIFWTFGDLSRASWQEIWILALLLALALGYFIYHRWDYNAMDGGEDMAKSLGVRVERVRLGGMFMASLITAVTVSFLGIIGFIGLVSPHISKSIIGRDQRYLIPGSALMGSLILLTSDTLSRVVLSPKTLPVGAVTLFLGAPLFLYILIKGVDKI